MNKHTPGPWFIYDDSHECPGIESKEVTIVVFGNKLTTNELRGVQGNTVEEAKANAQLIAAAPELLEAVERLLVCMNLANWEGDDTAIFARKVVAKAKGEI